LCIVEKKKRKIESSAEIRVMMHYLGLGMSFVSHVLLDWNHFFLQPRYDWGFQGQVCPLACFVKILHFGDIESQEWNKPIEPIWDITLICYLN